MIKLSTTLSRYLARKYIFNLLGILGVLLGMIYLFDAVELLRRANNKGDIPLALVLHMSLLKLPEVGQIILPFAILFSSIFTFWQLSRRHELVIVRAAGMSVWQFLAPIIGVALLAGMLHIAVINPVGALLLGKFEAMENSYLANRKSYVTLFKEGLWLRQAAGDGHIILHARKIKVPEWQLQNVMVLFFDNKDDFFQRIDAPSARLDNGEWLFQDSVVNKPKGPSETYQTLTLPTDLTIEDIEESFASPETVSFWSLPSFIGTMEETGFDTTRLRIHFQTLLVQPLLFAAMILIAAAVSLKPTGRSGGTFLMVITGVIAGFAVFFLSSFLQALGASHQIPIFLAAWSPAFITMLLGITVLMSVEDG
ncbi:MAG: LPS export ABC transporter permease LptG [Rhodospirillales bacterium]|nr:LPS export ABC transporter permease LptG [Rhodospirillales bacterium]